MAGMDFEDGQTAGDWRKAVPRSGYLGGRHPLLDVCVLGVQSPLPGSRERRGIGLEPPATLSLVLHLRMDRHRDQWAMGDGQRQVTGPRMASVVEGRAVLPGLKEGRWSDQLKAFTFHKLQKHK